MRKKTKKLVLAKETVRSLGKTDLAVPRGGTSAVCTASCGIMCETGLKCGGSGNVNCFATQQGSCTC